MKIRLIPTLLALALVGAAASSCVVHETEVRHSPCAGGVWIGGHYDAVGRWHPPHWRCPGVVEIIE